MSSYKGESNKGFSLIRKQSCKGPGARPETGGYIFWQLVMAVYLYVTGIRPWQLIHMATCHGTLHVAAYTNDRLWQLIQGGWGRYQDKGHFACSLLLCAGEVESATCMYGLPSESARTFHGGKVMDPALLHIATCCRLPIARHNFPKQRSRPDTRRNGSNVRCPAHKKRNAVESVRNVC